MSRYTGPKNRIARRFGANIFGKARNPMLHKQNPPGMHGAGRRRKKSDYGIALTEQQKLKAMYGMLSQKQLVRYYHKAEINPGVTAENFVALLETRLDNIVYRLKLAPTIFAAQQLVAHGHITVNRKKVDIRSFQVQPGMTIGVKEKSHNIGLIRHSRENMAREIPAYLESAGTLEGKLVHLPKEDQIPFSMPISISTICEFLAHTS
ncbi:MAG: 30S ribosomal protein S4 [Parachlamydiales bacterium]